jgi:hypothetical protein
MKRAALAVPWLTSLAVLLAGCGLDVQAPDLFALTRMGPGPKLRLVVNDSGTISCNGGSAHAISSARLIAARDLSDNLGGDATHNLKLPTPPGSVYTFRISMQQGTIAFADRDTGGHPNLAQAELFATQAAQQVCGLTG